MTRIISLAAAIASSVMLLSATAGHARTGGYYNATPVTASGKNVLVTRNVVWHCDDSGCVAGKAPARDMVVCELAAKNVGALSAFTANGTAFDADALAKCNDKAR